MLKKLFTEMQATFGRSYIVLENKFKDFLDKLGDRASIKRKHRHPN